VCITRNNIAMAISLNAIVEDQRTVSEGKYLITSVLVEGERYPLDVFEKSVTNKRDKGAKVKLTVEVSRKTGKLTASFA